MIQQQFLEDFANTPLQYEDVLTWLGSANGIVATPHSQRSSAELSIQLDANQSTLPLTDLIDDVEAALGTAVQTAVKRADEQAFALANGQNLMFCEDAARRVASALAADTRIAGWSARVAHFESLHPHDAVASVSGRNP